MTERLSERVTVRLTKKERLLLEKAAKQANRSLSNFLGWAGVERAKELSKKVKLEK